jgi:integrase
MPRPRTGTVVYVPPGGGEVLGHYKVRITCNDGSRPWVDLNPSPRSPEARAKAREAAAHYSEQFREQGVVGAPARRALSGGTPTANRTLRDWAELWFAARAERGLSSVKDDRGRFQSHIDPALGSMLVKEIGRSDVEKFVETLDTRVRAGEMSWKTALNAWAVVTRMFKDACRSKVTSLRVRTDNPCADVEGPDRGGEKAKCFLYPSEFAAFASCADVPLSWRRLVAVAVYLGVRAGELEALEWDDFDLTHGKVTIHRSIDRNAVSATKATKSETPRCFSVEPALLPLLRAMHRECAGRARVVEMPRHRDLAEKLRDFLKVAGVRRPELFISDKTRINLRFHDLRATAVTRMTVRGDSPALVMNRVGHEDWETMKKYLRQAEALVQGFGEVFPALPSSLVGGAVLTSFRPEFRPKRGNSAESLRGGRDSNPRPPA